MLNPNAGIGLVEVRTIIICITDLRFFPVLGKLCFTHYEPPPRVYGPLGRTGFHLN